MVRCPQEQLLNWTESGVLDETSIRVFSSLILCICNFRKICHVNLINLINPSRKSNGEQVYGSNIVASIYPDICQGRHLDSQLSRRQNRAQGSLWLCKHLASAYALAHSVLLKGGRPEDCPAPTHELRYNLV